MIWRKLMIQSIRRFLTSPAFLLIPFLIALAGLCGNWKILLISMIINAQIVAFILFFSDDLLPAFLTAFCVITLGATNLESLNDFVPYIPVTVTVVAGFIFHMIHYRRPIYIGKSFYGLVATSAAVLLSGIATPLATRDYTSLAAVYHIIGLSVGLILLYLLFAFNRREDRGYDPMQYFLWSMFYLGLLCAAVIFSEFLQWLIQAIDKGKSLRAYIFEYTNGFTYRNTIATLLIMCFPAAFYLAKQRKRLLAQLFFMLSALLLFGAIVLSSARTAWLCGIVLLFLCFGYYLYKNPFRIGKYIAPLLFLLLCALCIYPIRVPLLAILRSRLSQGLINPNEARIVLISRSFRDFLAHPLFGVGISSTINADVYSNKGCICWYHMYFPQLWGSMGLLGVGTYLYQLFVRAKLILADHSSEGTALGLIYLGLFLYSQTDVGEFAPIPYAVITVLLFVLLEKKPKKDALPTE